MAKEQETQKLLQALNSYLNIRGGGESTEASNKVAFRSGNMLLQSDLSTPSDASWLDEFSILIKITIK